MEPMDENDLADYFERTKAHQRRALAALGHRVSQRSQSAGESVATQEQSDAPASPGRVEGMRSDVVDVQGEATAAGAS